MDEDTKKLVEGYDNYNGSSVKLQKHSGSSGTTLSKSDLEEPYNIDKYISFTVQLMWYTTKVEHNVTNAARELAVQMINPGP